MKIKKLLVIGFTWPEPKATAAGNRMLQLLEFFTENNFQITFASTASESDLSLDFEQMKIKKAHIQLNNSSFDEFIKILQPEIVIFDRFLAEEQFGWRVAQFAPKAIRILDTEDLHSLRLAREKALKTNESFAPEVWLQTEICKRELASIFRSDLSLIISSYELRLLQETVKISPSILCYLPFMVKNIDEKLSNNWKSFENRTNFIFIGNGKHAPNVDAILWLKKEIWPLIRAQLPKANLKVYGAYLSKHIVQMNDPKNGFLVCGWANDVSEVMQNSKVNLAPLRFGAGLKGKLIDAMNNGTPSVTTAIGAEGLNNHLNFGGIIAENSSNFAEAAIQLYKSKSLWQTTQLEGINSINTLFNYSVLSEKLANNIKNIQKNIVLHRHQNIIGQLLQHQTMASTKYMSKWIEEKNKT